MRISPIANVASGFTLVLTAATMSAAAEPPSPPHFERDVRPLLVAHCYECHGKRNPEAGVDLRSVAFMSRTRKFSPVSVVPGSPERSRLYQTVKEGFMPPPPSGPLPEKDAETIRAWIAAGCPADDPEAVYGSEFFQRYGVALCVLAVLNVVAVAVLWRGRVGSGQTTIVLAGLPVIGLAASRFAWYPPDVWSIAAAAALGLGMCAGGGLIAVHNGRRLIVGAGFGLLGPVGLVPLARSPRGDGDNQPAAETGNEAG